MYRPAPAMRAERLAGALQRLLEERHRGLRPLEGEVVEAEIDEGADFDVAVFDAAADVETLAVHLDGTGEVAVLLPEPAIRVAHAREHEEILTLPRQRAATGERVPSAAIVAATDEREAAVRHPEHFVEAVVQLARG